jgi:hypothetical protein
MVFTMPFVPYPETLSVGRLSGYDPVRGYLHTKTVRWSFGAVKGREADQWQREVAGLRSDDLVKRLAVAGFDGLFVDKRGYAIDDNRHWFFPIALHRDDPRFAHPDGHQITYDLRPLRERLRKEIGPKFDDLAKRDAEAVRVLWLDGFYSFERPGEEWRHRWCGPTGTAVFVNPTDRPRTLRLEYVMRTYTNAPADVRVEGGELWTERVPVNSASAPVSRTVVVPPGRHVVRFRAKMPRDQLPSDSRRLTFFLAGFRATEADAARD